MRLPLCLMLLGFACGLGAQDRVVYDNALRGGFADCYSYGGGTDLLHATTTRNGSLYSIAFTGNNSNAVAFAHENVNFTTTDYVGVRFYVHGGVAGGQQLRFQLYNNLGGPALANVELDTYIAGGAIAANEWRLVEVRFANAPLSFAGTFERFDLQSDVAGAQPTLYVDDVALISAAPLTSSVFSDSFEGSCPPGPAGNLRFTAAASSVGEGAGSATIGVERVAGSFGPISVMYATSDGTALQPGDYASANGTLSWGAGEVGTRTFAVPIVNDASVEPGETINIALSGATGSATLVTPSSAVLTISDDDASLMSINDVTLTEGNAGPGPFAFTVTLSVPSTGTVTVQAVTADGTAVAPGDYTAQASTVTFPPGVTTQTVTVMVDGDATDELNETFFVNLSNPTGATIADGQGLGTINDDDPQPSISIDDVMLTEGDAGPTAFMFTVTLSAASGRTVTVNAQTADGSATGGSPFSDYTPLSSILTFTPGVTTQTVTVSVNGDMTSEPDETFFLNLSGAFNGVIADAQGLGTIRNNDPIPTITINDVSQTEGSAGGLVFKNFVFTVMLSHQSSGAITVQFNTADGTANAFDYIANSGTLTYQPYEMIKTITVQVRQDTNVEGNDTFFVNLTSPTGAIIADGQGLGTIVNDD